MAPRRTQAGQTRRRIGPLLASSNTTQEPEFISILPDDRALHVARLPLREVDPAATAKMLEDIETESCELAGGAIGLAATAPSSRNGNGYDQRPIGSPAGSTRQSANQCRRAIG